LCFQASEWSVVLSALLLATQYALSPSLASDFSALRRRNPDRLQYESEDAVASANPRALALAYVHPVSYALGAA